MYFLSWCSRLLVWSEVRTKTSLPLFQHPLSYTFTFRVVCISSDPAFSSPHPSLLPSDSHYSPESFKGILMDDNQHRHQLPGPWDLDSSFQFRSLAYVL